MTGWYEAAFSVIPAGVQVRYHDIGAGWRREYKLPAKPPEKRRYCAADCSRIPTWGWRLPPLAAPGKYQDNPNPIARETPTYAMASPKIAAFPSHNLPQMRATRRANLLGLARRRHPHLPGSRPGAWGGYHPK